MSRTSGRIDAHQHFLDPQRFCYPWMSGPVAALRRQLGPAELEGELRAAAVTGTVVVQACHDPAETQWLLEVAARVPWVLGVVGWVDLAARGVGDELARLRGGPGGHLLVGVRHQAHDEDDPAWLLREEVQQGIAAALDAGLAFDLLVRTRETGAARRVAERFAEGRFVLDHLAKPPVRTGELGPWRAGLESLAACPNVVAKVSGLVTEADWSRWSPADLLEPLEVAATAFGPERLMVGSDWPVCTLAAGYEEVLAVADLLCRGWSESERRALWGETAGRAYRLAGPAGDLLDEGARALTGGGSDLAGTAELPADDRPARGGTPAGAKPAPGETTSKEE